MSARPITLSEIRRDARGTAAVEFGLTGPIFIMLVVGIIEGGLLLWAQVGLQHGVEMAARYATTDPPPSTSAIKTYAAQQSFGLNPPASNFTVSTPACGNQVSASYSFPFTAYFPTPLTLSAQSCFPIYPP
ncbi:MAG: TadE/TadG family type IV pilus assembly protein [Methylococcales bacterium]